MQHVEDGQADIEPDEVGQRQRPHRVIHPALHHRIDRLRRAHALHHREERLVQHRHQDAVGDEARIVGGLDAVLAKLRAQFRSHLHRLVRGRLAADQLHQRHQRHGVHEVHAEHLVGALRGGAEQGDRDRRGVRREDHFGARERIEACEQVALGLGVLDDGLDDVVGIGQGVDGREGAEPGKGGVTVGRHQLALLDELREALVDGGACAFEHRLRHIDQPHVVARLREYLRNTVAHRARTHYADCLQGHRCCPVLGRGECDGWRRR